jgi:hypothetical protein
MCRLRRDLADLSAEALDAVPDPLLAEHIVALRADINRREAELTRRLAAFDARGAAGSEGSVSTAAWLRTRLGMSAAEASDRVRTARVLRRLPSTAAAFAAGSLSYRHAALIAATVGDLDHDRAIAADALLAGWAARLDVGRLRRLAARLLEVVEPDRALAEANAAHVRRRLHLSQTLDGGYRVDGWLDAEAGSVFAAVLFPLAARTGPDDTRTPAQRRADALTELARRALHGGDLPVTGGVPPHLTLVVDLPTLRPQVSDQDGTGTPAVHPERRGGGAGLPQAEHLERTGAWLDWSGPVTAETARRIACDAGISRVITDGPSQVVDVGRRTRIVTAAQRRALAVRDRGCRFPGCDRPPHMTDAHHIVHWVNGGLTDLDNLLLLCRTHHRACHEEGWSVHRGADGDVTFAPPGRASPPTAHPADHRAA